MNLLAKRLSFRKLLKPGLIMLIPVFFGCESSNDLGINYDLGTNANVKFIEFSLPATNIKIDSLRTDGESRALVGNYSDALTGSVSAEAYLQYIYDSGPLPRRGDDPDSVYLDTLLLDSIVMVFDTQNIIPNRSSSIHAFSMFELDNNLESSAVYLSNLQQSTSTFLGSFNETVGDPREDTVFRFKLEDSFANDFFSLLSEIAGDTTRFVTAETFQSIGIVPDAESTGIAAIDLFSDSTRMIVYSSPPDSTGRDTTYLTTFGFNRSVSVTPKHYTYLERDHSGSEFAGVEQFVDLDLSSGQTIIDPLAGITTTFSIAEIEDFFAANDNLLINNARLTFEYEDENERDSLIRFMNFFRKEDGTIFGPALASNSFGNIVLSDNGYSRFQADPATSIPSDQEIRTEVDGEVIVENEREILLSSTLFYQLLYRQFQESGSLLFENLITEDLIPISELVNISREELSMQRTIIKQDGIKLRLYYTEVDQ